MSKLLQYPNVFYCEECKYISTHRTNYNKHLKSKKHLKLKKIQILTKFHSCPPPLPPSCCFSGASKNILMKCKELDTSIFQRMKKLEMLKTQSTQIINEMQNMMNAEIGRIDHTTHTTPSPSKCV